MNQWLGGTGLVKWFNWMVDILIGGTPVFISIPPTNLFGRFTGGVGDKRTERREGGKVTCKKRITEKDGLKKR